MTLSVLSLLISFFSQISRISQSFHKREKKFLNIHKAIVRMVVKSSLLKNHHQFTNDTIELCLQDVFDTNEALADLHHRKDVSLSFEVFYINAVVKTKQSLIVLFETTILTQDQIINEKLSYKDLILQNIENIGIPGQTNNGEMISALKRHLHLTSSSNSSSARKKTNVSVNIAIVRSQSHNLIDGDVVHLNVDKAASTSNYYRNSSVNTNTNVDTNTQTNTNKVADFISLSMLASEAYIDKVNIKTPTGMTSTPGFNDDNDDDIYDAAEKNDKSMLEMIWKSEKGDDGANVNLQLQSSSMKTTTGTAGMNVNGEVIEGEGQQTVTATDPRGETAVAFGIKVSVSEGTEKTKPNDVNTPIL